MTPQDLALYAALLQSSDVAYAGATDQEALYAQTGYELDLGYLAAAGTVSGSIATAQGQTSASNGATSVSGTAAAAQGQTVAGTATAQVSAAATTRQGQTLAASGTTAISASDTSAQAQSAAAAANASISGSVSTVQGQASTGAADASVSGSIATAQAQSLSATETSAPSVTGVMATGQGQQATGNASVDAANPAGGGYDDDKPKKNKSYVVNVGDKLLAFSRQQDALDALARDQPKQYPAKKAAPQPVAPDREVTLAAVSALIAKAAYQAALEQKQYDALMQAYEAAQQDEDDIELLMMSL